MEYQTMDPTGMKGSLFRGLLQRHGSSRRFQTPVVGWGRGQWCEDRLELHNEQSIPRI